MLLCCYGDDKVVMLLYCYVDDKVAVFPLLTLHTTCHALLLATLQCPGVEKALVEPWDLIDIQ